MQEDFKDRLKYLLDNITIEDKKVTAYRIGKETPLSRVSIENYLSGKQKPSIDNATIIARYFNISTEWLLNGVGEMIIVRKETVKDETVEISKEAWDIIKKQAESLAMKDQQMGELITMLKKVNAHPEENAGCAAATGSDK